MAVSLRLRRAASSSALVLAAIGFLAWGGRAGATPTYLATVVAGCDAPATVRSSGVPSDALSCDIGTVSVSAWTSAGEGFIRAESQADLSFGGSAQTVSGYAQSASRLQDSFLVSALDASGSPIASGFLTAVVDVDAYAEASSQGGFASILWNFNVGGVARNGRALVPGPCGSSCSSTSGGSFVLQVPWTAGVPVGITFFANAEAQVGAQAGGSYYGLADFANSMEWTGISGVTDGSGTPVASFSALSPDGFDYAVAVPEPGTLALFALGLAGLSRCGRRRS